MPHSELARFLDAHRQVLIPVWLERVIALPGSTYAAVPPASIEHSLGRGLTAIVDSLHAQTSQPLEEHVRRVCDERARQGFTIGEVIQGFLLLKEVTTPFLVEEAGSAALASAWLRELDGCLRSTIATFSEIFSGQLIHSLEKITEALPDGFDRQRLVQVIADEARALSGARDAWVEVGSSQPNKGELRTGEHLWVDLTAHGRKVGTLGLEGLPTALDQLQIRLVDALASQAGLALEHVQLHERQARNAVLEERHRLARELHDSVTQALYAVSLYAEAAGRQLEGGRVETAQQQLAELQETALGALREMRLLLFELHPPELASQGFVRALETRLAAVEAKSGVRTDLELDRELELPAALETTFHRVATEALNNALKHGHAHVIQVLLGRTGAGLRLEIADDGEGFELEPALGGGTLGLRSMRERAAEIGGKLEIQTGVGKGTRVILRVEAPAAEEEGR